MNQHASTAESADVRREIAGLLARAVIHLHRQSRNIAEFDAGESSQNGLEFLAETPLSVTPTPGLTPGDDGDAI